jgi:ATP-binding cassette subfamily B protein
MRDGIEPAIHAATVPPLGGEAAGVAATLWWPQVRLGEALDELARRAGLVTSAVHDAQSAPVPDRVAEVERWLDWAAARFGIEVERVDATLPEFPALLLDVGPALVPLADLRGHGFFLLLKSRFGRLRLIGPDLRAHDCGVEDFRTMLCWRQEAPLVPEVQALLDVAGVPPQRRAAVQAALLRERLAGERAPPCWMLRLPPSAGLMQQAGRAHLPRKVLAVLAVFAVAYVFEIASWQVIGAAVLDGRFDVGWLTGWLLLMLTMIPLRLFGGWLNSTFALEAGRLLKARLLSGALRIDPDEVARQGVGHLLGRVIESQALEALILNGGMTALIGMLELAFAAWLLAIGAGGAWQVASLLTTVCATGWLGWRYFKRLRAWTLMRLDMTHDLIERMVGHRTRLAQERSERRDGAEDQAMRAYLDASKTMDAAVAPITAGVPGAWMMLGLLALAPAFVTGNASPGSLAIALGGILLAQRALGSVSGGITGLARAFVAWQQVAPLFHAGRALPDARPFIAEQRIASDDDTSLIEAHGIGFAYRDARPVLTNAGLTIAHGDRILLEGSSGGGKSTLASLLSGTRTPDAGLLLLNGLDRHTLGDDWHRLVTAAPQFNDNHILSGSLAFNLLMGREWPASEVDLEEAEQLCEALGLGALIKRMPAGLMQRVGETGWQLSHGERSRIFLARALLQKAQLAIMDESFAALDPETLARCLQCSLEHAKTLIVIAHP